MNIQVENLLGSDRNHYANESLNTFDHDSDQENVRHGSSYEDGNFHGQKNKKEPVLDEIYEGVVVTIVNNGAYINFGFHEDGFVRIGEIADRHIENVGSVLAVNDKVKVRFIGLNQRGRYQLSIKSAANDTGQPWEGVVGQIYDATVTKILEGTGAFVNFGAPREGMVRIGEFAPYHVTHLEGLINKGDVIKVRYAGIDSRGRYLLHAARDNITPVVGEVYKGRVVKVEKYGAFVNFHCARDGLVHVSEICDERIEHANERLAVGDVVNVRLLTIDDQGRPRLSIKRAQDSHQG